MSGNHEAVRRFGVMITEKSLDTKLKDMGVKGGMNKATEMLKVLARINILLAGTADAQGMAAKSAGSWATSIRALHGMWTDLSATVGRLFTPALAKAASFMREFVSRIRVSLGDTRLSARV